MKMIQIGEITADDDITAALLALSTAWAAENSCRGYRNNTQADLAGRRIFIARDEAEIIGYLFGKNELAASDNSVMPRGTPYFEIEELYVRADRRSSGLGRALYTCAAEACKKDGLLFLVLSTASKNYTKILHFYIDELGMEFWSARLFQKL
jgi:ribosomal protein S18 acetylase RimI-like enzyme